MNETNSDTNRRMKWFLPTIIFLSFLFPTISTGQEAKRSTTEREEADWKLVLDTECPAQQCPGVLIFPMEDKRVRRAENRSFVRRISRNCRVAEVARDLWRSSGSAPLHKQGHLEPAGSWSLTFCHTLYNCLSPMSVIIEKSLRVRGHILVEFELWK